VYTYDGDGKRVKKCASACTTGTLYWTGVGSDTLSESDLSGNMQKEYIYFNGGRVARRDVSANSVHYFFTNQLGSTSVITNNNGSTLEEDLDYYPYGGVASGTPTDHYEFTGKERDTESGLDNFGARYYGSSLGRFMTPDWSSKPQGVPYAVLDDPQSLNLYAYVGNNPLARIDPYGHASCTVDGEHHGSIWCWAHKHGFVETKHEQAQDLKQVLQQTGTTVYKNGKPVDLGKASDKDLLAIGDELRKQSGQAFFAQLNWTPPPLPGYPYMEKPNVTNPELQDIVDKLYQPTDVVPGGTAGAVRYEETTGKLLSPAGHAQKAQDVANELNTFLKNNPGISSNDQATAKELIRDLENAVAGK
jgi:RHS repeat-associated protein